MDWQLKDPEDRVGRLPSMEFRKRGTPTLQLRFTLPTDALPDDAPILLNVFAAVRAMAVTPVLERIREQIGQGEAVKWYRQVRERVAQVQAELASIDERIAELERQKERDALGRDPNFLATLGMIDEELAGLHQERERENRAFQAGQPMLAKAKADAEAEAKALFITLRDETRAELKKERAVLMAAIAKRMNDQLTRLVTLSEADSMLLRHAIDEGDALRLLDQEQPEPAPSAQPALPIRGQLEYSGLRPAVVGSEESK